MNKEVLKLLGMTALAYAVGHGGSLLVIRYIANKKKKTSAKKVE